MKSKKFFVALAIVALGLTSCEEKVEPIQANEAMNKLAVAATTTNWKGAYLEQNADLSVDVSTVAGKSSIALKDTLKAGISVNQDEMNKLKNGEDADLSNLITASAELTASYSNSTEVSYGDKSYTSKNDVSVNGSLKYGKTTLNEITSDFAVANLNMTSKKSSNVPNFTAGEQSQTLDYSLAIYNISSYLKDMIFDGNVGNDTDITVPTTPDEIQKGFADFAVQYGEYFTFAGNKNKVQMTGTITPELVNKVTNGSVQDLTVAGSLVAAATFDDNGAFTSINFDLKDLEASFKQDDKQFTIKGLLNFKINSDTKSIAAPSASDVKDSTIYVTPDQLKNIID